MRTTEGLASKITRPKRKTRPTLAEQQERAERYIKACLNCPLPTCKPSEATCALRVMGERQLT